MEEPELSNSVTPKTELIVEPLILLVEQCADITAVASSGDHEQHELGDKQTRIKSFVCPMCGKGFGRNSHLKRHVKIHDKREVSKYQDTPTVCASDTPAFQPDISLPTIHCNPKLLRCKPAVDRNSISAICGKGFGQKNNLRRHLKLHESKAFSPDKLSDENVVNMSDMTINGQPCDEPVKDRNEGPVDEGMSDVAVNPNKAPLSDDTSCDTFEPSEMSLNKTVNEATLITESGSLPCEAVETGGVIRNQDQSGLENSSSELSSKRPLIRNLICPVCSKGYGRNSHLKRHMKLHLGSKELHNCEFCEKSFLQRSYLKNHVNTCHSGVNPDERNFCCDICGKAFLRNSHLKRHEKIHMSFEYYNCDKCGKRFSQTSYLRAHIKAVHGRVGKLEKIFDCMVCNKSFGRMSHLRRHMKQHLGGPTFDCEECGKGFLQNDNLKTHVRIVHSKDKAFECDVCNKRFPQRSNLNTHMRIHTGEKPFMCSVCGRAFSQGNQLKTHMRTHSGEKPYACLVCGKRFTNNRGKFRHELAHSRASHPKKKCPKDKNEGDKRAATKSSVIENDEQIEVGGVPFRLKEETDDVVKEEPEFEELTYDDDVTGGEKS